GSELAADGRARPRDRLGDAHRLGVAQVGVDRRHDDASFDRDQVDPDQRHADPGVDDDALVQDAVEDVDETRATWRSVNRHGCPPWLLAAAAAGTRSRRWRIDRASLELTLQLGDARLEPLDHLLLVPVAGRMDQTLIVAPPVQPDLLGLVD